MLNETKRTQKRLLKESVWVIGGRVFGIATAIGANVVLARVVSPADFGSYFVLASILTFASLVAMFGLNTGLVRFVSEGIGIGDLGQVTLALRRGTGLALIALISGALLCWLFVRYWGQDLFQIPDAETIAPLLAVSVIAWGVIQLCAALLRSFHDSRWSILLTGQFGGPLCNTLFMVLILRWRSVGTRSTWSLRPSAAPSRCASLCLSPWLRWRRPVAVACPSWLKNREKPRQMRCGGGPC